MSLKISPEIRDGLMAVLSDQGSVTPFDLTDDMIKWLLVEFNLKIQKTTSGHICFHGHNVGNGIVADSSGKALALFLKSSGLKINSEEVAKSIEDFCREIFS